MSSHHIVRDKQEPALLITGVNGFSMELLGQLLEWSPTVIATAATAEFLQDNGINIDWLLAEGLSETMQSDVRLLPCGISPVETVLNVLLNEGYTAVNLITDVFDPEPLKVFANRINLVIFCAGKKISTMKSGFKKWKPAGERIKFLTLPHNFVYSNLNKQSDDAYEVTDDGWVSLNFSDDYLFMVEEL